MVMPGIDGDADVETIRRAKVSDKVPAYRVRWHVHAREITGGPIATAWDATTRPTINVLDEGGVHSQRGSAGTRRQLTVPSPRNRGPYPDQWRGASLRVTSRTPDAYGSPAVTARDSLVSRMTSRSLPKPNKKSPSIVLSSFRVPE